ncbi:hypothetical protein LguiB_000586 [Lonicera macranthoides]
MSDDGISERAESLVEKIKDAVHKHSSSSSSSSSSDNENDINLLSHPKKKRLFGRQKPVHAVLGGGKLFVMVLTLPLLYEMHEDQVDSYAELATVELKKHYSVLDDKVIRKLPKVPFLKDHKQH